MTDLFHRFEGEDALSKKKVLRPHQEAAINLVRASLKARKRRVVLLGPTGFGKTLVAAKIIEGALDKGNRVIFTAPAISLIDQTVAAFEAEGIRDIGVMQAQHPRTNPLARVQVASVQTLARREIPEAALVMVDECFPAGTMVSTPFGQTPIENIKLGQAVLTAVGPSIVNAMTVSRAGELYKLEIDDGTVIECTGNHPILTENGWTPARRLAAGSFIFGPEDMPSLWGDTFTETEIERGGERGGLECKADLFKIMLKEVDKSFAQQASARKDIKDIEAYIASSCRSWWQRNWVHHAADLSARGARVGVGYGSDCECVEGQEKGRMAESLQAGLSECGVNDGHRGGWRQSWPYGSQNFGREEGRVPARRRVVSVSRIECGSDVDVYNLEVGGHPSYFANGVLVHNCHIGAVAVDRLMDERPDVFFIGLSATPWAKGMGLRWDDLVTPCTIGDLIEAGYLSKFTAYAPTIPNLDGVKVTAGEYAEAALMDVMGDAPLMASIVKTWLDKGENRPTLLFGINCAHAQALQAEFARAGVSAGYVDAFTDSVERKRLERQFRSGEVKVACSVRTLTTGVDWPVSCIIDAAPTKSEMLHVQKIGRGLRVNPGTEDLIILDHAGNSLRLGLVTDIHHDTLDKTRKGEKQERAKAEKLPTECSACSTLFSGKVCPFCGHERKPVAMVETADGELSQITGKVKIPTKAEKQAFYSMAIGLANERGYKLGWAANKYREKMGVWPRGLNVTPARPDQAFLNWEKSRRIAWVKKQEKIGGAA